MAEVIARREARRQKILANSEYRLKKITGVEDKKASFDLDGYKTPKSINNEISIDSSEIQFNSTIYSSHSVPALSNHHNLPTSVSNSISELRTLLQNENISSNVSNGESVEQSNSVKTQNSLYKAYCLVTIALISTVCDFFYPELFLNYIFGPFLCFEIANLVYLNNIFQVSSSSSSTLISVLLLSNRRINPYVLDRVIRGFKMLTVIFEDMMVYFFVYVCSYHLLKFLV